MPREKRKTQTILCRGILEEADQEALVLVEEADLVAEDSQAEEASVAVEEAPAGKRINMSVLFNNYAWLF